MNSNYFTLWGILFPLSSRSAVYLSLTCTPLLINLQFIFTILRGKIYYTITKTHGAQTLRSEEHKLNVRLACVKHLDSVQSEPSPNSSISVTNILVLYLLHLLHSKVELPCYFKHFFTAKPLCMAKNLKTLFSLFTKKKIFYWITMNLN